MRWATGYQGIKGNKQADRVAKEACNQATSRSIITLSRSNWAYGEQYKDETEQYRDDHCPKRYKDLAIIIYEKLPPEY